MDWKAESRDLLSGNQLSPHIVCPCAGHLACLVKLFSFLFEKEKFETFHLSLIHSIFFLYFTTKLREEKSTYINCFIKHYQLWQIAFSKMIAMNSNSPLLESNYPPLCVLPLVTCLYPTTCRSRVTLCDFLSQIRRGHVIYICYFQTAHLLDNQQPPWTLLSEQP